MGSKIRRGIIVALSVFLIFLFAIIIINAIQLESIDPIYYRHFTWSLEADKFAFVIDNRAMKNDLHISETDYSGEIKIRQDVSPCIQWSSDGQFLVFNVRGYLSDNPGIYRVQADGSSLINLTHPQTGGCPSLSPDDTKIAFVSSQDKAVQIFVMDADGSNEKHLLTSDKDICPIVWSPDSSQIALSYCEWLKDRGLYVIDIDVSELIQLTTLPVHAPILWSPDNQRIAFTNSAGLYLINIDNMEVIQVYENLSGESIGDIHWARLNNELSFVVLPDREILTLAID